MVNQIELKYQKYHCRRYQRIAADRLFSEHRNPMAGMVCVDPIVVWIKRTNTHRQLSNWLYYRSVPLSLFAVLARAGDANLRLPTLVSVDNDIDSLFGCAGTFCGFIFNDYQQFGR